ncbi:MAG: hypothetical protein ACTS6J_25710 [Burkholderiales bacterium]
MMKGIAASRSLRAEKSLNGGLDGFMAQRYQNRIAAGRSRRACAKAGGILTGNGEVYTLQAAPREKTDTTFQREERNSG